MGEQLLAGQSLTVHDTRLTLIANLEGSVKSTYKRQWHLLSAVILTLLTISPASAELGRVKVATQIGLSYLPLVIMQHD